MSNVNIDSVFSEYVLKEFQLVEIANYPKKIIPFLTGTKKFWDKRGRFSYQILRNNNQIENRSTNKGYSIFIKHTSRSYFHEVNCKEKTKNSKTVAQTMQTSALMNHSYVSNDFFDDFYVNYIEFNKSVDDIVISLNANTKYAENLEVTTIKVN